MALRFHRDQQLILHRLRDLISRLLDRIVDADSWPTRVKIVHRIHRSSTFDDVQPRTDLGKAWENLHDGRFGRDGTQPLRPPGSNARWSWTTAVFSAHARERSASLVQRSHAPSTGPSPECLNTAVPSSFIPHTYLLAMTQLKDWVHLTVSSALHSAVWDCYELPSGISAGQFLLVCFRAFH